MRRCSGACSAAGGPLEETLATLDDFVHQGKTRYVWLLTRPGVTAPILGARTLQQLLDNLGAAGWRLEPAHVSALEVPSRLEPEYPARYLAGADRFA